MAYKLLLFCFLLCACTSRRIIETDLYFGQSKPDGGSVSEEEWERFKSSQLSRAFKEGFTILDGRGAWYDPDNRRQITEPTYVVIYFHKPSGQVSKRIDSLRTWYKTAFNQQSVLRVDKKVKAAF